MPNVTAAALAAANNRREHGGQLEREEAVDADEEAPLLGGLQKPLKFVAVEEIILREHANIGADRTGEVLTKGTVFEGYEIVTHEAGGHPVQWDHVPLDEPCFVFLGEGRGWAINRNLVTNEFLIDQVEEGRRGVGYIRLVLRKAFQTSAYETLIMIIILLNAVAIGAEIDFHHSLSDRSWLAVNWTFAITYVLELSLKLFAFGPLQFFESWWNIFDFLITAVTLVGDIIPLVTGNESVAAAIAPVLRLLRLLRLAKVFRELATLLRSLAASLLALLWIAIFTILWFYISACMATVFVGEKRWLRDEDIVGGAAQAQELRDKFKTIPMSMYSLFEVMTLEGWTDVVRPLVHYRPMLVVFFICFIFITAFFLLNLVTAVVVDRTMAAQQEDGASKSAVEEDGHDKQVFDLRLDFVRRNGGQDLARRSDLSRWLETPSIKNRLHKLDWEPISLEAAALIHDKQNTGLVSLKQLSQTVATSARPLSSVSMLRMEAEMMQRLAFQDEMLRRMMGILEAQGR